MSEKINQLHVVCEPRLSAVCSLLGEGRTDSGQIKEIYDEELAHLRGLVKPAALLGKIETDQAAVLLTVGEEGEQYVRELFAQGEHLRGLVADAMLSAWLFVMDEKVQEEIRIFCDRHGVGVAKRLEAPEEMPMEMQDTICEALHAEQLVGVRASDAHMLVPEKSMCYVLKLCDDREQFAAGHDCTHCPKIDCKMRKKSRDTKTIREKSECSEGRDEGAKRKEIGKEVTVQNRSERNCKGTEKLRKERREMSGMKIGKNAENSKNVIQIVVEDQGKKCLCEEESVLIDTLREHGVRIDAPCGGSGRCGKCRVRVVSGELPVTAEDRAFLSEREIATGVRLACTARPMTDLRIRVLAKPGKQIAAVAQMSGVAGVDAGKQFEKYHAVQDISAAKEQILAEGKERKKTERATGQSVDPESRNRILEQMSGDATGSKNVGNGSVDETASEKQEVFFAADEKGYGIGIDIGTTTLAACLYGWSDGTVYRTVTAVNSGRDFGADVLSRMEASCHGKRARLQELLQEDVCALLGQLLGQSGVQAVDVKKIVIAANMTMVHLLMGYSCETLGRAPFVPANKRMICADAMRILGDSSLRCPVVILPAVSAFVGGDIVSGMLALGMDQGEDTVLLLDIGTNGEMALRHNGHIYVTSTAAGPAFEGGGISCGCASVPGAVCGVKFADDMRDRSDSLTEGQADGSNSGTYREQGFMLRTIGDVTPAGICGSGVLELVSELLRVGLLDETGLFAQAYRESGFSLAKTASGESIVFTQGDVRALQLAKGAIRAGIEALLAAAGVRAQEVSQVYLAGGFGVRMDEHAAIRIGLLPGKFGGRIRPVGNSSLSGAVFAGRCAQLESACEDLLAQCSQVVLAEQPEFEENYVKYMNL